MSDDHNPLGIAPPSVYNEQWTVSGDLREIVNLEIDRRPGTGQSTNHVIVTALVVLGWSHEDLDPEWSCFFGYADNEVDACKLRDDAIRLARSLEAPGSPDHLGTNPR